MFGQSAAASVVPSQVYSNQIPAFLPNPSDLLFYYDFGNPYSYIGAGSVLTDLVTGTRKASIVGGHYSASNGGEYYLTSGSYIDLGNDSVFNLGRGPISIFISFETLDTSKRSYILNKKESTATGPGYILNAEPINLYASGSTTAYTQVELTVGGANTAVDPGELGYGIVTYESGSGYIPVPGTSYPLGVSILNSSVTVRQDTSGGNQEEISNNLNLYVGRNNAGSDYANIKVQAIWGYSVWGEDVASNTIRNHYTASRY